MIEMFASSGHKIIEAGARIFDEQNREKTLPSIRDLWRLPAAQIRSRR